MATKSIFGWKFDDSTDFENKRSSLDETLGLPVSPTAVTQTSMNSIANKNPNDPDIVLFYYVGYNSDPAFTLVLGDPINFDINVEDAPNVPD